MGNLSLDEINIDKTHISFILEKISRDIMDDNGLHSHFNDLLIRIGDAEEED